MILVTGATGTVGREVAKALQASGARFKVGVRSPQSPTPVVESVTLDFDRPETLPPALAGVEAVFLLSNAVMPELNVVRAARAAEVQRIVKLSVWNAPDESFTFARRHRAVEREIEASGLSWTFVRPNGFMQNVVTYMGATIRDQSAFYQPAGDARISHVDARDIGACAAEVLTTSGHAGKAYALSGPQALSYGEIAETLSRVLGRTIRYVSISDEEYKKGAMGAGVPEADAEALADLVRYYRTGAASRVTTTTTDLTGRQPISFEEFARDHAAAWR